MTSTITINESTVDPIHYAWESWKRGVSLPSALRTKNTGGSPLRIESLERRAHACRGASVARGGRCPGGDPFTPPIRATTHTRVKLHQLRYLAAVVQNDLNITAAAQKLHTSQPGVSKQIKLLEEELGFQLFVREGRNLARVTPAGQQVIDRALRILKETQSIRDLSADLRDEGEGSLSIGTTHTQARYVLPEVVREFRRRYPEVRLHLHQGTSEQIAEMVADDRIDCAIGTGSEHLFPDLTLLPCYRWHRSVIVPRGHALAGVGKLTLRSLAPFPLITYTFSFSGSSSLHETFARAGLTPNVAITAHDADVIRTYVRLGLGVGIVAPMAVDPEDPHLIAIDAKHLFSAHTTWLGFRRGTLVRKYMIDFAQLFAPHLDRRLIERAHRAANSAEVARWFEGLALPQR